MGRGGGVGQSGGRGERRKETWHGRGRRGRVRRGGRIWRDSFAGALSQTKTDRKDPQSFSVPRSCDEITQLVLDVDGLKQCIPRHVPPRAVT